MQGTLSNFDGEKGTATYIPKQGYSGNDHFRFRAIDDKGFESNVAQVDINIDEVSESNKTQANGLTEYYKEDTTNQTSTERDNGTNSSEQPNQPPNANAGNDKNAEVNTEVKLMAARVLTKMEKLFRTSGNKQVVLKLILNNLMTQTQL